MECSDKSSSHSSFYPRSSSSLTWLEQAYSHELNLGLCCRELVTHRIEAEIISHSVGLIFLFRNFSLLGFFKVFHHHHMRFCKCFMVHLISGVCISAERNNASETWIFSIQGVFFKIYPMYSNLNSSLFIIIMLNVY